VIPDDFAEWDVTAGDGLEEEDMTLAIGNMVVKCDVDGNPIRGESYILFEVIDLTHSAKDNCIGTRHLNEHGEPRTDESGNTVQFVKLRRLS